MSTQLTATKPSTGPENTGLVGWPAGTLGGALSVRSKDKELAIPQNEVSYQCFRYLLATNSSSTAHTFPFATKYF